MITNGISRLGKEKIRFWLLVVFLVLPMGLTGCGRQAEDTEQSTFYAAEEKETEENVESVPTAEQEDSVDIPDNGTSAGFTGEMVTQVIEGSDGKKITIDAQVYADGIDGVSCYRYVPEPATEEFRNVLLKRMLPAETWDVLEAMSYNPEKDAWECVTPVGEPWEYQVTRSEIPEEEIFNCENTAADISGVKQVYPVVIQRDRMEVDENELLMTVIGTVVPELETIGLNYIGSIDKEGNYDGGYFCSFVHICEEEDGEFFAKAVFKRILDGIPVTAWHDYMTVTKKSSTFPVKVCGSHFSVEEIGLDQPILSANEAVAAMQEQIDLIPLQDEGMTFTKISLEYLSVISSDKNLLIVPIWRFWTGNEEEWSLMGEEVIAVNAISGEFIWESRKTFTE